MDKWNSHGKVKPTKLFVSSVRDAVTESGFKVEWSINPHMKVGSACTEKAEAEHRAFVDVLRDCGAEICEVPFIPGAYDSVFMKDNAVVVKNRDGVHALMAKPFSKERREEPMHRCGDLEHAGVHVHSHASVDLEGGDVAVCACEQVAFLGYGFRSSSTAAEELEKFLKFPVTALELVDPYFYHLDTALSLTCCDGRCVAFAVRSAFSVESWQRLNDHPQIHTVIEVPREEALRFGLNWVEIDDQIVLGSHVPVIAANLQSLGKKVRVSPLSQFQLAGGSAACLVASVHELN